MNIYLIIGITTLFILVALAGAGVYKERPPGLSVVVIAAVMLFVGYMAGRYR